MILIKDTSGLLSLTTGTASRTEVHIGFADYDGTSNPIAVDSVSAVIQAAGVQNLISGVAGKKRNIVGMFVRNTGGLAQRVTVTLTNSGINTVLTEMDLLTNESLTLDETGMFSRLDASGGLYKSGLKGDPGSKGDQGDPGPKGDQGDPGPPGSGGGGTSGAPSYMPETFIFEIPANTQLLFSEGIEMEAGAAIEFNEKSILIQV